MPNHGDQQAIVVSGGSGFLGSWIVRALYKEKIPVVLLLRPSSDCWRLAGLENLNILRSEPQDWPGIISRLKPRVVVAADWEGVAGANRTDREKQFGNISRSYAVAEAAKNAGVETFIAFGSQAEIGPRPYPLSEVEEDRPNSAYGEAKVLLRKNLRTLFMDSSVRFVWGRIFSIYGPLDLSTGMLPTLIRTLKEDRNFDATEGQQIWSYLHAADFAATVLRIINDRDITHIVNIGNPAGVPVKEVINCVAHYMNRSKLVNFGAVEIDSVQSQYLIPITSKLTDHLWQPTISLTDGLQGTVDWFMGTSMTWDGQELPLFKEE